MISQEHGSLIDQAFEQFNPDVFSHPVWVHFGRKGKPVSSVIIEKLQNAAQQLHRNSDTGSACQVLLVCAVLKNFNGNHHAALKSTHQALVLAEQAGLTREVVWSTWGMCATCVQEGDFRSAAWYLELLRVRLNEQEDWVLSNFIEMVRRALLRRVYSDNPVHHSPSHQQPVENLLAFTLDWLQHWGLIRQAAFLGTAADSNHDDHADQPDYPLFSTQRWRGIWRTIKRVASGELRLAWVSGNGSLQAAVEIKQNKVEADIQTNQQMRKLPFIESNVSQPLQSITENQPFELSNPVSSLMVYCLGKFRVYRNDQLIEKWHGNKGKQVLKYLVIHRNQAVTNEILMEQFWPDLDPQRARRNLYQAVYNLRKAMQTNDEESPCILTEDIYYRLNPELDIWVDSEAFSNHYQNAKKLSKHGQHEEALREFETAENLYQGEFLAEDRYEDWLVIYRENLENAYLDVLDHLSQHHYLQAQHILCIHYCHKILAEDNCREDIHRRVMMCYAAMGQPHLALRQYHSCVEIVRKELDVPPMPATVELYKQIRNNRHQ